MSLSVSRQKELVRINRILASLVVVLAFSTGILLALREEWLTQTGKPIQSMPETMIATISGNLALPKPPATPFFQLLQTARYDTVLDNSPLSKSSLFQLLWAAQGKITTWGERTVPSYKSNYPISLIVFVRKIEQIPSGWYRFNAETQQLEPLATMPLTLVFPEDIPGLLQAPVIIVASVTSGLEGDGLTWNEAGGIAQNILLAARNDHLATFLLPATLLPSNFRDQLKKSQETLLWLMPIGQSKLPGTQMKESLK